MKEILFYQIRQANVLPLAELSLFVRQAFISLYPGTSFDETMTAAYGSENSFFLSRRGRPESIVVFVTPDALDSETLASFSRKAAGAEVSAQKFLHPTREILISIVAAEIPDPIKAELSAGQPDWSLFEYVLLQSETEEGLALKPVQGHARPVAAPVRLPSAPVRAPNIRQERPSSGGGGLPDRRLSPEELSALIDLSLGLEMHARGMDIALPLPAPRSAKTPSSGSHGRRDADIDA